MKHLKIRDIGVPEGDKWEWGRKSLWRNKNLGFPNVAEIPVYRLKKATQFLTMNRGNHGNWNQSEKRLWQQPEKWHVHTGTSYIWHFIRQKKWWPGNNRRRKASSQNPVYRENVSPNGHVICIGSYTKTEEVYFKRVCSKGEAFLPFP